MNETVGSVAEEAAKLLSALEDWWRDKVGEVHQGPECAVCPICQGLAMVRTARPEVFEHLTQASVSLLLAVRAVVDAAPQPGRRSSTIERIDIS